MASGAGHFEGKMSGGSGDRVRGDEEQFISAMEAVVERMEMLKIKTDGKCPMMADKKKPGTLNRGEVILATNVYGLKLPNIPIFRYDVAILALTKKGKQLELTKQTRDDFASTDRRKKCVKVFEQVKVKKLLDAESDKQVVYYDGQKIMYTLFKMKMDEGDKKRVIILTEQDFITQLGFKDEMVHVSFTINEVSEDSHFTLSDLSRVSNNVSLADNTLVQFINIATSEYAIFNSDKYQIFGSGTCYFNDSTVMGFREMDAPVLKEGKKVSVGAHKAASYIEGPRGMGNINLAVSIDTAKTAFHLSQNVLEKATAIVPDLLKLPSISPGHVAILRKLMKGITVETRHPKIPGRRFQISSVTTKNALDTRFKKDDGVELSVFNHYKSRYGFELKFPKAPLLGVSLGKKKLYYPMEISYVLPGQRVRQEQQTPAQLSGMRHACIVRPSDRKEQNQLSVKGLRLLDPSNPWLTGSEIYILPNPLLVKGRYLPPPIITYGNGRKEYTQNMKWKLGRNAFYSPATCQKWAAYVLVHQNRPPLAERDFRQFIDEFTKTAKNHGMKIDSCGDSRLISGNPGSIEQVIERAYGAHCQFVLFIEDDRSTLHDTIKLLERKYEVLTQCVKADVALSVIKSGKRLTMENIIMKTNVKLGGLSYSLSGPATGPYALSQRSRLIVGLSMSNACGQDTRAPVVIAYAANTQNDPLQFVGDFNVQPSGAKVFDALHSFMVNIVKKFVETRESISSVIIYRSGVSEGQYANVLQLEVPALRLALADCGFPSCPLTLLTASRAHRNRLIPKDLDMSARPTDQNIGPGIVVDSRLVHPRFKEFYLSSHFALQGTSKVPRYTVIVDDLKMEMDDLEILTFSLCFDHQIVTLPTSVPTPLYVANRYSERGRRMMHIYNSRDGDSESNGSGEDRFKLEEINENLSYGKTRLGNRRINA